MKQNKKTISLAVVLSLIISMFASFVVVNAADESVYTAVKEAADGSLTLEVGYKGFDGVSALIFSGTVQLPEGVKANASDVVLSSVANSLGVKANVTAANALKWSSATTDAVALGAEGVLLTLPVTLDPAPTAAANYSFDFSALKIKVDDTKTYALTDVTATNGTYSYAPAVTGPQVYVKDAQIVDGKVTLAVAYKELTQSYNFHTFGITVPIPEGFTADGSVVLSDYMNQLGVKANITSKNEVKLSGAQTDDIASGTEGDIFTLALKAPEGFTGTVVVTPTAFKAKVDDTLTLSLDNGVKAAGGKLTTDPLDEPTVSPSPTPTAEPVVSPTPTAEPVVSPTPTPEPGTPSPADDKTNMNASEVPETVNVNGQPVSIKAFAANVAALDPAVRTAMKAKVEDGQTYKLVFDFKTAKGVAAGWGVVYLTADQLREILDDPTKANNYKVGFANADASKTETHFEYENGTVLTD